MQIRRLEEYCRVLGPLVPLRPKTKRPYGRDWNDEENVLRTPEAVRTWWQQHPGDNVGLALAYAGVAAIDIDDFTATARVFDERGVELEDFLTADDAVCIDSGRSNRAKLIYRTPVPLATVTPARGVQFRCATEEGITLQDVLPPSIHPATGAAYRWIGDWRAVPPLPAFFRTWWESCLRAPPETEEDPTASMTLQLLRAALLSINAVEASYDKWLEYGMALHDFSADTGLVVWEEWSKEDSLRFNAGECVTKWKGFRRRTRRVTWRSIWNDAQALGWQPSAELLFDEVDERELDTSWTVEDLQEDRESQNRTFWLHQRDFAAEVRPVEWVVEGMLEVDTLSALIGKPGAKKSFLALDLALHVANGLPWHGRAVQPTAAVYIAGEGRGGLARRVRAWNTHHDPLADPEAPFYLMSRRAYLLEEHEPARLVRSLQGAGITPGLLVVDTLSRNFGPGDENRDMASFIGACDQLKEAFPGATVLIVHHVSRAGALPRGHSAFEGAMDSWALVSTEPTGDVLLDMQKMREGELPPLLAFGAEEVEVYKSEELIVHSLALTFQGERERTEEKVPDARAGESRARWERVQALRCIAEESGVRLAVRAARLGWSESRLRKAIAFLEADRLVEHKRGRDYVVTDAGRAWLEETDTFQEQEETQ